MNTFWGLDGRAYYIGQKALSSGGEGDIYPIEGDSSIVLKLYHSGVVSHELENKIKYMVKNPPSSKVMNQVAWPIDVVYNSLKSFCGFVMPKLDITNELSEIYVYPPNKTTANMAYSYKIIIALNICTVIHAVHNAGYVFGDFNPRNIGVNLNSGHVAFLDTDSYHIVIDENTNKAYRCNVCLDGYVAPELLKKCESYKKDAYANVPLPTFTKETDYFALAIHIFKLLMNGYTPFNGIKESDSASTSSPGIGNQAIKRDSYCFKPGNKPQAVAVPSLEILPDEIVDLFTRAFMYGRMDPKQRPSAKEWYSALDAYSSLLVECQKNSLHMYKRGLSSCPWCEADERYKNVFEKPQGTQRSFPTPVVPVITASAASTTSSQVSQQQIITPIQSNTYGGGTQYSLPIQVQNQIGSASNTTSKYKKVRAKKQQGIDIGRIYKFAEIALVIWTCGFFVFFPYEISAYSEEYFNNYYARDICIYEAFFFLIVAVICLVKHRTCDYPILITGILIVLFPIFLIIASFISLGRIGWDFAKVQLIIFSGILVVFSIAGRILVK